MWSSINILRNKKKNNKKTFLTKKIVQIEISVLVLKNVILYAKWNERELWKMVSWHTCIQGSEINDSCLRTSAAHPYKKKKINNGRDSKLKLKLKSGRSPISPLETLKRQCKSLSSADSTTKTRQLSPLHCPKLAKMSVEICTLHTFVRLWED